jgi:hypothetical protein
MSRKPLAGTDLNVIKKHKHDTSPVRTCAQVIGSGEKFYRVCTLYFIPTRTQVYYIQCGFYVLNPREERVH